jgi:hypothetical protein
MENADKIKKIISSVMSIVLRMAGGITTAAMRVIKWIVQITDWFSNLDEGTQKLILAAGGLLAAWKLLNLGFLASPIGIVVGLVTALVVVVEDLLTYMEGGESYFNWGAWLPEIQSLIDGFNRFKEGALEVFEKIKSKVTETFDILSPIVINFADAVSGYISVAVESAIAIFNAFSDEISGIFDGISFIIKNVWDGVVSIISGFIETLTGIFNGLTALLKGDWESVGESIEEIWNGIVKFIEGIVQTVGGIIGGLVKVVIEIMTIVKRSIIAFFSAAWDRAMERIDQFVQWFKGLPGRIGEAISGIVDELIGPFKSAYARIVGMWNKLKSIVGLGDDEPENLDGINKNRERLEAAGYKFDDNGNITYAPLEGYTEEALANLAAFDRNHLVPTPGEERAMSSEANNTQTNTFHTKADITVNGAGDPQAVAEKTADKLDSLSRNHQSKMGPYPNLGKGRG